MNIMQVSVAVLLAAVLGVSEAYKVLVVYPFPSKSHGNLGDGIVRHLLAAGHEVTYITCFPWEKTPPRLTQVDISSVKDAMPQDMMKIKDLAEGKTPFGDDMVLFFANVLAQEGIKHENTLKLLNDPKQKFDVVVVEWFFSDLTAGYSAVFECPLVWSSTTEVHFQALRKIDDNPNPAYTPDITSHCIPPLSFVERVRELYNQIRKSIILDYIIAPKEKAAYEEYFVAAGKKRGVVMPDFATVATNASILLANSHPSMGFPYKLPANVKHVGGYHIQTPTAPLPEDFQKIMDNAKDGVILFSMGSNLKSKDMSDEMKQELLQVFGELKQTVFWKFEEELKGVPKNVIIRNWMPQTSILAHPNLRIFITHGGLLSTTETIHFGVPVIGIPVFGDQFVNMGQAAKKGYAIQVNLNVDTPKHLREALKKMLGDPSYNSRAKELSAIYHDRPVPPGKELVHWIEHAVRTRGATHLRSPALDTPVYQKLYLDLLGLIFVILILLVVVLKKLCKKICPNKNKKEDKVKRS